MAYKVSSTKAKVQDAENLREVLKRYALQGVAFGQDSDGSFGAVTGYDGDTWPQAIRLDPFPRPSIDPDAQAQFRAKVKKALGKRGDEGFLALLREMAPCLKTPLTILVLAIGKGALRAASAWSIYPGCDKVEVWAFAD